MANVESGVLTDPTPFQTDLFHFYSGMILVIASIVGLFLARREWIKGRALVPGYPYASTPTAT